MPGAIFAKLLLLNHSSITGALNGLEKLGYIGREQTANNKRATCGQVICVPAVSDGCVEDIAAGTIFKSDTIEGLAEQLDIDPTVPDGMFAPHPFPEPR